MADQIVGIMWNKNEGDILHFTISKALEHVDHMYLADDGSTDDSFKIMQSFAQHPKVKFVHQINPKFDKRTSMLTHIKKRYKPENTLVQVIESDITILDTDIRTAWAKYNSNNVSMCWHLVNATDPNKWQDESGCFPTWERPIDSVMTEGHWMEEMSNYTFRPFPDIHFMPGDSKPWPRGFGSYGVTSKLKLHKDAPLLAHWGYRGPTHWLHKYNPTKDPKKLHRKHHWKIGTVEQVKANVPFFNGVWNRNTFPLNREGWATQCRK